MTQKYSVKLSMNQVAAVKTGLVLKQGDFGMQIEIEVLDFNVSGTTPQIVFRKPIGAVESTTITVLSNKYTYTFQGTELDTPGRVICDLKLKNSTTQRISSASFQFDVIADTLDGLSEEASSYSDTIEQIIDGFDDEILELQSSLKSLDDGKTLDAFKLYPYAISSSTGKWIYSVDDLKCIGVFVSGGEKLAIQPNSSYRTSIAFLKTFAPEAGEDAVFCNGYTSVTVLPLGISEFLVPNDCKYIYIMIYNHGNDYTPITLEINEVDYLASIPSNIVYNATNIATNTEKITEIISNIGKFNSQNIIKSLRNAPNGTVNGISFVADNNNIDFTASGTASADVVISYLDKTAPLPNFIIPGSSYEIGIDSTNENLKILIRAYDGASIIGDLYYGNLHSIIRIPENTTNMFIAVKIESGSIIPSNTKAHPYWLCAYSNKTLAEANGNLKNALITSLYLGIQSDYIQLINANLDLNSLDPGVYRVADSATAATLINTPVIDCAFRLIVTYLHASERYAQIVLCNDSVPRIYVRIKSNNTTWGTWEKLSLDKNYDYLFNLIYNIIDVKSDVLLRCNISSNGVIVSNNSYSLCLYYIGDRQVISQIVTNDSSLVFSFFENKPIIGAVSYNGGRNTNDGPSINNVTIPTNCKWIAIRCPLIEPLARIYPLTEKDGIFQPSPSSKIETHQIAAFDRKVQNGSYRIQSATTDGDKIYMIGGHTSKNGMARLIKIYSLKGASVDLSSYYDLEVGHANDITYKDGYLYIVQAESDNNMDTKKIFKVDVSSGNIVETYTAPYSVSQIECFNGEFYLGMNSLYKTSDFETYTRVKKNFVEMATSYALNVLGKTITFVQTLSSLYDHLVITASFKDNNEVDAYNKAIIFYLSKDMQAIENAYIIDLENNEEMETALIYQNSCYFFSDGLYYPTIRTIGGYKRTYSIENNTDLNNIMAIGEYSYDEQTETLLNIPDGLTASFNMSVKRSNKSIRQIIYSDENPCKIYTRIQKQSVGWDNWSEIEFV